MATFEVNTLVDEADYGAEINMIVSVGKGTDKGVWGPRYRVPYEEVVFKR